MPDTGDVSNADGFVSAAEGVPAYGPIVVSLTTSGGTGAGLGDALALALDRAPVAEGGVLEYQRGRIPFTAVADTGYGPGGGTAEQIAASVREGEGVLVIHGVGYDDSGTYSINAAFRGAESELVKAEARVPPEAVDPATCGVLAVVPARG